MPDANQKTVAWGAAKVSIRTIKNPTYYGVNKWLDTTGPDDKPDGNVILKVAAANIGARLAEGESFRG